MGTNYYLRTGICKCCGRYDELHICKSFRTWVGHYHDDPEPPWNAVFDIANWQQWKSRLRLEVANGGEIRDEYDKVIALHEFLDRAEATGPDPERSQYEWCRERGEKIDVLEPGSTWIDPEGFTFYAGEFS